MVKERKKYLKLIYIQHRVVWREDININYCVCVWGSVTAEMIKACTCIGGTLRLACHKKCTVSLFAFGVAPVGSVRTAPVKHWAKCALTAYYVTSAGARTCFPQASNLTPSHQHAPFVWEVVEHKLKETWEA